MKFIRSFSVLIMLFVGHTADAQTYTWTGFPAGGTSYVNGIMTTTITSSTPGYQNGAPKYYAAASVGSGQCGIAGGLALEQMFGNVTAAHVTLTMDFTSSATTNGTCASISFQIKDINADESSQTFRDFVHISAIDGTNTNIAVANITTSGGSNKTITTSGGTTRIIAGSSGTYGSRSTTSCDNVTITVTPPAGVPLKSIVVRYQPSYEAASSTTGYWSFTSPYRPAYQYISIGSLTATPTGGCTVLPIQLTQFETKCEYNKRVFNWATASEMNNDFFTLEGSSDGGNFETLLSVQGSGTTNMEHNYTATLDFVKEELNYFRLKQTDFDGNFSFSTILVADKCNNDEVELVDLYPVPATDELNLHFNYLPKDLQGMEIIDASGKLIRTVHANEINNAVNYKIPLRDISKGIYFLKLNVKEFRAKSVFKFVKE
jgi:Secretion system C-terminal sorting domain